MPIYSLTAERLEKLKQAIAKKKGEHDDLAKLSDKDLWCRDLDAFMEVWDEQMRIDAEIQTSIRRMGRRASKKIGAGRGRKPKDDDEYEPEKKSKAKGKAAAVKVETKSSQRFAEMFSAKPKPKKEPEPKLKEEDDFSDNDFAALSRNKPAAKEKPKAKPAPSASASLSASEEPEPEPSRNKRAVVSKAKSYFAVDSSSDEGDDDKMLEDVGDLVKGIGKESADTPGRLSLYAMSRPESSHGLSKAKSKPSRVLDEDSVDDTNYEMLAKPSPHKPSQADDIDSFLSDDDEPSPAPVAKSKPAPKSKPSSTEPPGLLVAKKARGRPAGAKNKAKEDAPAKKAVGSLKQTTLSPAAKAYAAKKAVKKSALVDDSDEEVEEPESPAPRAAARSRPGRAAAARRPIVIEEDSSMQVDEDEDDDEESDDPFNMDDDDD